MLFAAVAPDTKVVPYLCPLPFQAIPRDVKRCRLPLSAGLRRRFSPVFSKRLVWLPCLRPQMSDSVHDR